MLAKVIDMNWKETIKKALKANDWILAQIIKSKTKDFVNPFRKMMYDSQLEMDEVLGTIDDIPFLKSAEQDNHIFVKECKRLQKWVNSIGNRQINQKTKMPSSQKPKRPNKQKTK